MAKILRKTQKIFGINAPTAQITTFGTAMTANPNNSRDLDDIQNANFLAGWASAIQSDKAPYEEDTNGLFYAITSQLGYLFQQGIAEWDAGTTYYLNSQCSVVQDGILVIKRSLTDNNTNNNPLTDDGTNWADYFSQRVIHTIGDPIFTLNPVKEDNEIWLDGSPVSRTTYANLFQVYGTTYGIGDGETTFNLPDFRDRTIWGLPENGSLGYIDAGLPNITGGPFASPNGLHTWGAIYKAGSMGGAKAGTEGTDDAMYFAASSSNAIYGASNTVQPKAIKVRVKTRWQ